MPEQITTVFKPEISFDVKTFNSEEQTTIVHCHVHYFTSIRIWPSTFLVQEDGKRKKLLHAFNISAYPEWKYIYPGHQFTLVFEGLDPSCKVFDLFEDIPEPGGFQVSNIQRNLSDVYHLDID